MSHQAHERVTEWTHARTQEVRSMLGEKQRCVLTYARQTSHATLQVHVDSDWAGDLLGKKEHDRGDCQRHMSCLQTLVALSSDSRSVHELGNSITLPRLDQFSSKECRKKTWNWRTSETFADTTLMAAERVALGHLKLDVVAGEQNPADTLTIHCQVARFVSGQNMLVQDGCIEALARLNTS